MKKMIILLIVVILSFLVSLKAFLLHKDLIVEIPNNEETTENENTDNSVVSLFRGKITDIKLSKTKVYLAVNTIYTPTLVYNYEGIIDKRVTWTSSNPKVVSVNSGGSVKALKKGTADVCAHIMTEEVCMTVTSTKLITKKPKKFNYDKPYLTCNNYSKKENDLLDKILKDRIKTVGYKTRAGAVEAARFLALEFPYRITYFSENGRLATNGVDGEGRYYHKGLYLHKSRYKEIKKSMNGPAEWGCYMYSVPAHGQRRNGFDCSGFISWVLYNGGFNVKDVGAGLSNSLDLTDYGKRKVFTSDLIKKKKIKVGDLLSSGGPGGGHIAIIVGEDSKYYYVAESLWTYPNVGVVIVPYSKKNIYNVYYYVMLMDSYYKKDGKLTKMWY